MKTAACLLALVFLAAAAPLRADMVGEQLPKVTLNYVGKTPDIKGKPMLLEFWATWCPPCRKSIPHLNEIYAKFKDRGLAVVGVTDESEMVIRKFEKEVPMDYPVATDTGGRLGEKLGVSSIPTAFLVDKEGKITWQGHPMNLPEAEIEKILQ